MTRSTLRGAAVAALAALLSGCGAERAMPSEEPPSASTVSVDETRVSCGGDPPGWPVSAMDGGIESRFPEEELAGALETFADEVGIDAPPALQGTSTDQASWFVLAETATTVTVATGAWDGAGPEDAAQVVHLEKVGDRWQANSWGDCGDLSPVLDRGRQWVRITPAPGLDPSSTELKVMVQEVSCTSGRDPRPFLRPPTIVERADRVTVSWTSEVAEGGQHCVGNAPVPQTVELEEPLGDRLLLDGSSWPARPVAGQ